jgi:hypothetical protein
MQIPDWVVLQVGSLEDSVVYLEALGLIHLVIRHLQLSIRIQACSILELAQEIHRANPTC